MQTLPAALSPLIIEFSRCFPNPFGNTPKRFWPAPSSLLASAPSPLACASAVWPTITAFRTTIAWVWKRTGSGTIWRLGAVRRCWGCLAGDVAGRWLDPKTKPGRAHGGLAREKVADFCGCDRQCQTLFVEQLPFFNIDHQRRDLQNPALVVRALNRRGLLCRVMDKVELKRC